MDYNIWLTILGEQIKTPITGTLQSALTQQQSPPLTRVHTRNVDREDQFDSGLWNLVIRCTELKVMTIALACLSILI